MAAPDLTSQIESTAAGPVSAMTDGMQMQAQPLEGLIAADKYLKANAAMCTRNAGVRFRRLRLPKQVDVPLNSGPPYGGNWS